MEAVPGITREEFIKTYPYRDTTLEGELNKIIEAGELGIEKGLITRKQLDEKVKEFNEVIDRTFEAVRAEEEAVPEAKIKYFRQQEMKWRETAYKIAEEERGEAPFATAMEKAEDFARQARELEAKSPAVEEAVPEVEIEKGQILSIENPKSWNEVVQGKRVKVHEVRSDGRIAASYVDKADIKRFSAKIFIFEREELLPKPPAVSVVDYDRQYSLEELREKARQEGLSPSGSKKEIAAKLIARGVK